MTDVTDDRLVKSIYALKDAAPLLSAERTFIPRQRNGILIAVATAAITTALWWRIALPVLIGLATLAYLSTILFRVSLMYHATRHPEIATVSDEDARAVPDDELPVYTVMIPCYKEPEVVAQYRAMGFDFVAVASDLGLMMGAARAAVASMKASTSPAAAPAPGPSGY